MKTKLIKMSLEFKVVCLFVLWFLCEFKSSDSSGLRRERYFVFKNNDFLYNSDRNRDYSFRNSHFVYKNKNQNYLWDEPSINSDRLDFHYPKVEFLTKIDRKYSMSNHPNEEKDNFSDEKVVADVAVKPTRFSRKNPYKIKKIYSNEIPLQPIKLLYTNKVQKPNENITLENKYEEHEEIINNTTNTTKANIHEILKNYLMKLYTRKYNKTDTTSVSPNTDPESVQTGEATKHEAENKFIGGVATNLKLKAINKSKLFSLFTIVQFSNTQCNATSSTGSYIGVCYTQAECNRIEGTALGNCARGYGVCCVVLGTCGGWASQNCSYFQSPNYPDYYPSGDSVIVPTTVAPTTTTANPSPTPDPRLTWYFMTNAYGRQSDNSQNCVFSVYKSSSNVNRFRIDFLDLELTGPTNGTCMTEQLIISGQNSNDRIPPICGYNTGQHVYVDVSMLQGPLQISVLSTMNLRKRFNIRIFQYADTCLEPNSNCLQYYTGVSGTISSFNYDQVAMFNRSLPGYSNNLNYAICIRREAGYCSITFTNMMNGMEYPFQFLNNDMDGTSTIPRGQAGVGVMDCPDDFIVIDGARLCGDKFNDGTMTNNASLNAPVTDTGAGPIVISVRTDSTVTGVGFKLFYTQNRCMPTK